MLRGVFVEGAVARFELAVSGHEPNELTITLYCIMLRFCLICLLIKGAFFSKSLYNPTNCLSSLANSGNRTHLSGSTDQH